MAKLQPKTVHEVLQLLAPWLAKHQRPAWHPVVKKGDGPLTASKYSGIPWLSPDEEWPVCQRCQRPLALFLQLNLDDLPAETGGMYGTGLLQLFYCRFSGSAGDCPYDGGYEPFDESGKRVCIVQPSARPKAPPLPKDLKLFPPKSITGWKGFDDYPRTAEHDDLGLLCSYDFKAKTVQVHCAELDLLSAKFALNKEGAGLAERIEDLLGRGCDGGDKLGGWPCWIQDVEYPACPTCKKRMQHVFQVTGDPLPFMFGDMGIGHITQCPRHKDIVAFGWSCH
jgi:hypothetical protein